MALPGASKLDEHQVENIKKLFAIGGYKDQQIADLYNVSRVHIGQIRRGKRWNAEKRSYVSQIEMNRLRPKKTIQVVSVSKPNLYDVICKMVEKLIKLIKK